VPLAEAVAGSSRDAEPLLAHARSDVVLQHVGLADRRIGPAGLRAFAAAWSRVGSRQRVLVEGTITPAPELLIVQTVAVDDLERVVTRQLHVVESQRGKVAVVRAYGPELRERARPDAATWAPSARAGGAAGGAGPPPRLAPELEASRLVAALASGDAAALAARLAPRVIVAWGDHEETFTVADALARLDEELWRPLPRRTVELGVAHRAGARLVWTLRIRGVLQPRRIPVTVHLGVVASVANGGIDRVWLYPGTGELHAQPMGNQGLGSRLTDAERAQLRREFGPPALYCCAHGSGDRDCWRVADADEEACRSANHSALRCRKAVGCEGAACYCCENGIDAACDPTEPDVAPDLPPVPRRTRGGVWSPF
jgi:hypothetical protein